MGTSKEDASHYLKKSEAYRIKARESADPRIRAALEAVAREYVRRANESDSAAATNKNGVH